MRCSSRRAERQQGSADRAVVHLAVRPASRLPRRPAGRRRPTPACTSTCRSPTTTSALASPRNTTRSSSNFEAGINVNFEFPPGTFQVASPGQTVTFGADVTGSEDADPGVHDGDHLGRRLRRLVVRAIERASSTSSCRRRRGASSSRAQRADDHQHQRRRRSDSDRRRRRLVVRTPDAATGAVCRSRLRRLTLALFQHWLTDQTVNGFTVRGAPADAAADPGRLAQDARPASWTSIGRRSRWGRSSTASTCATSPETVGG